MAKKVATHKQAAQEAHAQVMKHHVKGGMMGPGPHDHAIGDQESVMEDANEKPTKDDQY